MAAFDKATGVYAMRTTDGDDTISVGFTGKAVILWATLNTAEDSTAADGVMAFGISDGTTHFSVCSAVQDNQATSNANRYHQNAALVLTDNTGAKIVAATAVSFSGSNMTITWDWVGGGTAYLIHYLVLGGTDLTNVKVMNSFTAKTSTGTQARTGFGFQPDFLMFISAQDNGSPTGGHANTGAAFTFGCAANKASRNLMTFGTPVEDASATELARSYELLTYPWVAYYAKGIGVTLNGSFTMNSWDSDGYTENWDNAAGNAYYFGVLGLKGLKYDIEDDLTPTGTGNDSLTGFGFQPEAMMHFCLPTLNSTSMNDATVGIGACTSTSDEHACWWGDDDAAATSATDQRSTATYHLLRMAPGTPTLDVEASLVSFDSDGFTQNFNTAPAAAKGQAWIAFGPTTAATSTRRRTGPTLMSPGIF